jgi:hypothetical protein
VLLAAARVGWVAWEHRPPTVRHTPINLNDSTTTPRPKLPLDLDQLRGQLIPSVPSELMSPEALASANAQDTRPKQSRVYLVVNVAPDRSEVLINGVSRGQTPYVGEIGCQRGAKLTITVVPPTGLPKLFERDCDRTEIRIGE